MEVSGEGDNLLTGARFFPLRVLGMHKIETWLILAGEPSYWGSLGK